MRRAAGIGHQQQLDPRLVLQQFPGQVGQAPHAGGGIGDFAGTLFGERDQLRQGRDAQGRSDRDEHRVLRHEPDRQKVFRHMQGNIRRRRMQRHESRQHRLVERVSIRRGFRRRPRCDAAAATRAIDHQGLLAPGLGQPIGNEPQGHVRCAAGGRIRDDLYRLARVGLGLCIGGIKGRYRQQPREKIAAPICFHRALQRSVRTLVMTAAISPGRFVP